MIDVIESASVRGAGEEFPGQAHPEHECIGLIPDILNRQKIIFFLVRL